MKAEYRRHVLVFKRPSGTSRGVLLEKESWFFILEENGKQGIGECGLLRGLSIDDRPDYEEKLAWTCNNIHLGKELLHQALTEFPSIQMGLEMAFLSLESKDGFSLFPSTFSCGETPIPINGLIWMGEQQFMLDQVDEKIAQGFRCIKMKVGAIAFEQELAILKAIRDRYTKEEMLLRVDANGAFDNDALDKLKLLSELDIHSIEQPIAQGNWEAMKTLCQKSPLPIALDEELIGVFTTKEKQILLDTIQPHFIILKPSFIGGFHGATQWTKLARERGIGVWVTSALESNIGLNAIAQWTYKMGFEGFQGLGTGSLYTNNIPAPLEIKNGYLSVDNSLTWRPIDQLLS